MSVCASLNKSADDAVLGATCSSLAERVTSRDGLAPLPEQEDGASATSVKQKPATSKVMDQSAEDNNRSFQVLLGLISEDEHESSSMMQQPIDRSIEVKTEPT